ncbi:sensor histidine kinase [Streptomyces sp. NRRL F-2799]|uniref:sensor histidine kinase n=1 Tax=Streptomyces sp. NRRL F-2799 TaxID=1463844 RepID=UPI00099C1134|nr:sensor histidine kinase [Streptomyces sp. NRRL F-2799]
MALVVLLGTVIGANLLNRTADVTDTLLKQVQPAQTEAYRLQAALVDQETGIRGYAITADPSFRTPYVQGKQDEADAADRLRRLVGGRPELRRDVDTIERQAAEWRRNYAEPLSRSIDPGHPKAIDQQKLERGKEEFDRLRSRWTQQNAHLVRALQDGRADLDHERTLRNSGLAAMVAAFLITGLVLAVFVRLLVTRPLERLRTASRRVAGGDFDHIITGGGPTDLTAVAVDVEGMRKRIVAELDASHAQQRILTAQAADLDAQAVELRRSNVELEQFAYVASHDLQEPLRKVASFCQLLEKRYYDKLDDRGRQYIDFAVDGAKRMQVLINDLLTFSRVGRLTDDRVPVGLEKALEKAMMNLAAAVEESGARFERPKEMPEVVGDPTLFTMLWQNLIGNALKFRHPDRAPQVTVTCEPDPDEPGSVKLSVTDNGIGIPGEFADKVFVIFQRLHSRDAYGGTGIGLALCKKIVEHHGGRIWLDTEYTGGTRFRFTLPMATVPDETGTHSEEKALT